MHVRSPAQKVVMQDQLSGHLVDQWVKYNHGRGSVIIPFPDINPSAGYRLGQLYSSADGANLLFYDNSVKWYLFDQLDDVGQICRPGSSSDPDQRVWSNLR